MDDFARMMLQEGVRPLDAKVTGSDKYRSARDETKTGEQPTADRPETTIVFAPAWKGGADARSTLEAAIEMAREDRQAGAATWITGIRQDGKAMTMRPEATIGEIISAADREDLRLITIAGREWTCIMHPSMGIATIEHDAK